MSCRTLVFLVGLLVLGTQASAKAPYALYQFPGMDNGCLPPIDSSDAKEILKRNGITYKGNPSEGELDALARGIKQVEALHGSPLPKKWQTQYNYVNASGSWNQGASAINVRRPKGTGLGHNCGRLMHELGHKIGNSGTYAQYRDAIRGKECHISPYAKSKNNEQFAEAFEAFVVNPGLLKEKCPKAYDFFTEKLFKGSEDKVLLCKVGSSKSGKKGKGVR